MSVILQVSDSHFGTEQSTVVEALVQLGREQTPDLVVVTGDITQRARRHQFQLAGEFVTRLAVRNTLVIPGNHDIPLFNLFSRVFHPYANYQRVFGADLEPAFESADLLVLGVNTTRASRYKNGEVSTAQIARVSQRLRSAQASQLRIVITHQPVHVIDSKDKRNLLLGYQEAVRTWAKEGVDLILGGHIHLPYACALRESFPDLTRNVWAIQAGTAVSSRIRSGIPNSVNLIRYVESEKSKQCEVFRWDYDSETRRFVVVDHYNIRLSE